MKTYTTKDGQAWSEPESKEDLTRADVMDALTYAMEWQDDEPRVDYEDLYDRAEGVTLNDGTRLSLPGNLSSPIFTEIKRLTRAHRAGL